MKLFNKKQVIALCLAFISSLFLFSEAEAQTPECKALEATYRQARKAFNVKAAVYWTNIAKKKNVRKTKRSRNQKITKEDYVLSHPPEYTGPSRPKCLDEGKPPVKQKPESDIEVVEDFLAAAKKEYNYVPASTDERSFKKAYATQALAVGLTANQVVGVYALETGGIGPYYRQSGLLPVDQECRKIPTKGTAISTALGYAQLLAANSSVVVKEQGDEFADQLEFEAVMATGPRKQELLKKAKMLRKMAHDVKVGIKKFKVRNNWKEFIAFSKTPKGMAIHAVNLDIDIGPRLQVQKLKRITQMAARKGHHNISGAQLELLNLAGPGRGLEMMTPVALNAPSSNFFERDGYERNPVSKNLTAKGLLDKIDQIIARQKTKCGSIEFMQVFNDLSNGGKASGKPQKNKVLPKEVHRKETHTKESNPKKSHR